MPQPATIYRILISSPSDCIHEKRILSEVIFEWNAVNSLPLSVIIEPVRWETHTHPELGDRPQAIVNNQIVDSCDLLVATFWTRLGTPTGEAQSGTVEEIERFRAAGKPTMLYFSSVPIVPESIDHDQYQALVKYRNSLQDQGLYSSYESEADFRDQFHRHLAAQMTRMIQQSSADQPTLPERDKRSGKEAILQLQSALDDFLRRFTVEWKSERDSDPMGIDDGKYIINKAYNDVVNLRSMIISNEGNEITGPLEEIARQLRILSRHELYIDGGVSFATFWDEGNKIIDRLNALNASMLTNINRK